MAETESYTIGELAEKAAVTTRTIRYYVTEGLLPAPDKSGRAATYSDDHVARLALIKVLKEEFLPLQEISALLAGLDHRAVLDLLEEKQQLETPAPTPNRAKEYLQTLLNPAAEPPEAQTMMRHRLKAKKSREQEAEGLREGAPSPPGQVTDQSDRRPQAAFGVGRASRAEEAAGDELVDLPAATAPTQAERQVAGQEQRASQWQRIQITPDVELHIRLGLEKTSVWQKIEQLIAIARRLFSLL